MRAPGPGAAALAALAAAAACQLVAPFDQTELGCPCPGGYECDEEQGRCRRIAEDREDTVLACRDGLDNDGDLAEDCLDQDCIEAGACEQYEWECDPFGSGECPAGLVCALTKRADDNEIITVCRRAGFRQVGEECMRSGDPAVVCTAGAVCVVEGPDVDATCRRLCATDADCQRHDAQAICGIELDVEEFDYGICTTSCLPWASRTHCPSNYLCRPLHFDPAEPRTAGGTVTGCLNRDLYSLVGEVAQGEACVPDSTRATELCQEGLLCMPIAGPFLCVRPCNADPEVTPPTGCAPCESLGPIEAPIFTAGGGILGVCYGDAP